MLFYVITAVIGYLLGSISIAVLLTKYRYGGDVREAGSGNAGATNVARIYGMKAGLITLFADMTKTALSALIGLLLAGQIGLAIGCGACLVGHCWPLYFGFRGGKGVSVGACIGLLLDWRMFLIGLAGFFLLFFISRRVSLCSICAAASYPVIYLLLGHIKDSGFVVACMVTVIVIILHRENIARLVKGEEAPFHPGGSK